MYRLLQWAEKQQQQLHEYYLNIYKEWGSARRGAARAARAQRPRRWGRLRAAPCARLARDSTRSPRRIHRYIHVQ